MLLRTAKSCGPDVPTLASSSRRLSRPYRAQTKPYPLTTVAKEPGHRGEHEISRKTIACGNAGRSGVLVVTRVRSTNTKCTRGRGCSGHPAFPTPSSGRKINARLGRIASRGANVCLELTVMASSDATRQPIFPLHLGQGRAPHPSKCVIGACSIHREVLPLATANGL
jgi:hypothetical protein